MRGVITRAVRSVLSGLVLVGGVLAATEIAGYKERGDLKFATSVPGPDVHVPAFWFFWVTPWWAYAVAAGVALLGLVLAVLIYPGRDPRVTAHVALGEIRTYRLSPWR